MTSRQHGGPDHGTEGQGQPPTPDFESVRTPARPKRRRWVLWTVVIAAVAVAVVVIGTNVIVTGPGSGDDAPTSEEADTPGWKTLSTGGVAVDVPADWETQPAKTPDGFDIQTALYRSGACGRPGTSRGMAYTLNSYDSDDPQKATGIYTEAVRQQIVKGLPSEPSTDQTRVERLGDTVRARTTVRNPQPDDCNPPETEIVISATPNDEKGSYVLISAWDRGIADAIPEPVVDQIADSVRAAD